MNNRRSLTAQKRPKRELPSYNCGHRFLVACHNAGRLPSSYSLLSEQLGVLDLERFLADTFDRLMDLISSQHHLDTSKVTAESGLADVGLDSLAVAELLFSIEETFNISLGDVPPESVPATVGEIVNMIDGKLKAS